MPMIAHQKMKNKIKTAQTHKVRLGNKRKPISKNKILKRWQKSSEVRSRSKTSKMDGGVSTSGVASVKTFLSE